MEVPFRTAGGDAGLARHQLEQRPRRQQLARLGTAAGHAVERRRVVVASSDCACANCAGVSAATVRRTSARSTVSAGEPVSGGGGSSTAGLTSAAFSTLNTLSALAGLVICPVPAGARGAAWPAAPAAAAARYQRHGRRDGTASSRTPVSRSAATRLLAAALNAQCYRDVTEPLTLLLAKASVWVTYHPSTRRPAAIDNDARGRHGCVPLSGVASPGLVRRSPARPD